MNHSVELSHQPQRVDGFFLDNDTLPQCHLGQFCDVCPPLVNLDTEILRIHNHLVNLVNQRYALKRNVNYRHGRLMHRLPLEIISRIFCFYDSDPDQAWIDGSPPAALVLGGVCGLWRDVTFQIPQLWSSIKITFKESHSDDHPYQLDIAREWLCRSRTLPLNINIDFMQHNIPLEESSEQLVAIIDLVRSHSGRWENVVINVRKACHLHAVFNKLQVIPANLESLSIELHLSMEEENMAFNMDHLLLPKRVSLTLGNPVLWSLPCSWWRLTHLSAKGMQFDELLWIIRNASNLTHCTATDVETGSGLINLPAAPIINPSVIFLHTSDTFEDSLFEGPGPCLILPSLQTLKYDYYHTMDDDSSIESLLFFLKRSSPPLVDFHFKSTPREYDTNIRAWNKLLPFTTSVGLDTSELMGCREMSQISKKLNMTSTFLANLSSSNPFEPAILPILRTLSLDVDTLTLDHWSTLCDILEERTQETFVEASESLTELGVMLSTTVRRGVLKSVEINGKETLNLFQESVHPHISRRILDLVARGLDLRINGVPYTNVMDWFVHWINQRQLETALGITQ